MSFDETILEGLNEACVDTLGQSVTVSGVPIDAVFDNEYSGLSGLGVGVESSEPILTCKSSDVVGVCHGAEAVVDGVLYRVVGVDPDGAGITSLRIEKQ